jgi:hypothetical protein
MRQFSATYIKALKDALTASFWYKNELREFLKASMKDHKLVDGLEWGNKDKKKRDILDGLLSFMVENESSFITDINVLTRGVLEISRYKSLEKLDDRDFRLSEARTAKEVLRKCFEEHAKNFEGKKKAIEFDYLKGEFERRKKEDEERLRRREEEDELRERDPLKYYGHVLGLKGRITKEEIKKRYIELIRLYHPDRFANLDEEFVALANYRTQRINEAYQYIAEKHKL